MCRLNAEGILDSSCVAPLAHTYRLRDACTDLGFFPAAFNTEFSRSDDLRLSTDF